MGESFEETLFTVDDSSNGLCGNVLVQVYKGANLNPGFIEGITYDGSGVATLEIKTSNLKRVGTRTIDVEWYLEDHPTVTYS